MLGQSDETPSGKLAAIFFICFRGICLHCSLPCQRVERGRVHRRRRGHYRTQSRRSRNEKERRPGNAGAHIRSLCSSRGDKHVVANHPAEKLDRQAGFDKPPGKGCREGRIRTGTVGRCLARRRRIDHQDVIHLDTYEPVRLDPAHALVSNVEDAHFGRRRADLVVDGPTRDLRHKMLHYYIRSFDHMIAKMTRYANWGAAQMFIDGKTTNLWGIFSHTFARVASTSRPSAESSCSRSRRVRARAASAHAAVAVMCFQKLTENPGY